MTDEERPAAKRVLVVDDCPDTTAALSLLLRMWGCDARVAHDGPGALAEAAVYRPDVVLLDVGLPGMDGYEVARALRADPATAAVRLLCLSGFTREDEPQRAREAGIDATLVKPVDPLTLRRVLLQEAGDVRPAPARAECPSRPGP